MKSQESNIVALRETLGIFPTGVTIVTSADSEGNYVGMTVSSFNSVSLTPPLILWSIDKSSASYSTFINSEYFAIHVLSDGQQALSQKFSIGGEDKFDDVRTALNANGVPILPGCAACFQCRVESCYEGGDHTIVVGRVLEMEKTTKAPLVFYRGDYHRVSKSNKEVA